MNKFYTKTVPKIVVFNFIVNFVFLINIWLSCWGCVDNLEDIVLIMKSNEGSNFIIGIIIMIVLNLNIIKRRKKEIEGFSTYMYIIFVIILPIITPIIMLKVIQTIGPLLGLCTIV